MEATAVRDEAFLSRLTYDVRPETNGVQAIWVSEGERRVGMISWNVRTGNIAWVQVYEDRDQRQGLASEMLQRARQINPKVHHSTDLSESGAAWAGAVASKTASKTVRLYHGTVADRVASIKSQGLIPPPGTGPGWYMLTSSREQAAWYARREGGVVLTFDVPEERIFGSPAYRDAEGEREFWLWPATPHIEDLHPGAMAYAVNNVLPASTLVSVTPSKTAKTAAFEERRVTLKDGTEVVLMRQPPGTYSDRSIGAFVDTKHGRVEAGYLLWEKASPPGWQGRPPMIDSVHVNASWQRKGLATAMLAFAREFEPDLQHSHALTDDGQAWSQVTASTSQRLYRGYALLMPSQADRDEFRRMSKDDQADIVLSMLANSRYNPDNLGVSAQYGMGMHWSTDSYAAERWAATRTGFNPLVVGVVVTAEHPGDEYLITDPAFLENHGVSQYGDEQEVTIKPGTSLRVVEIGWNPEEYAADYIRKAVDVRKTAAWNTSPPAISPTKYGEGYVARGLTFDADEALAKKIIAGTVTARDILSKIGDVGIWWWPMGNGTTIEDPMTYAEGMGDENYTVKGMAADGDYEGEVRLVIVAKSPKRNGEWWDPEKHNPPNGLMGNSNLDPGERLEVVEIMYDAGWDWKALPAQGIQVTASGKSLADLSDSEFASKKWLYHGTNSEADLDRLLSQGIRMSNVPMNMNRRRYQEGDIEGIFYQPGAGVGMGLYVTGDYYQAQQFGHHVIAIDWQPSDKVVLPPESDDPNYKMEWALRDANGVLLASDVPASRVYLVKRNSTHYDYDPRGEHRTAKTAGPAGGRIPSSVKARPPSDLHQPRPVKIDRKAGEDIEGLEPDERALVIGALKRLERGIDPTIEAKHRQPLVGCFSIDVTASMRVLFYLHVDRSWHIFAVLPDHDYDEAERRMRSVAANAKSAVEVRESDYSHPGSRRPPKYRGVDAFLGGMVVGGLTWYTSTGEIGDVWVQRTLRRQGIATAMLAKAREIDPRVHHSTDLSDSGRAWSEKVAALMRKEYEGTVGDRSHITCSEVGTVPTSVVATMAGVKGEVPGEHRNRLGERWEAFKADIAANGITEPIFITVDYGEEPKISEGNHRRDAAVELGLDEVPVEIRYFGHAERTSRVAGRGGDLPEGFEIEDAGLRGQGSPIERHILVAQVFGSKPIGHLYWYTQTGEIGDVLVKDEYQRRGIASALLTRAREIDPRVHHSQILSDDAKAWSQKMASTYTVFVGWGARNEAAPLPTSGPISPPAFTPDSHGRIVRVEAESDTEAIMLATQMLNSGGTNPITSLLPDGFPTSAEILSMEAAWNPSEHPRGQPENAGWFREKGAPQYVRPPKDNPLPKHVRPPVEKERYSGDERKARGDVYDHYTAAGKYAEGDPRNDPDFERMEIYKAALTDRYVGMTRKRITDAIKKGASDEDVRKMWDKYHQDKVDRDLDLGGDTEELFDRKVNPDTGARNWYKASRNRLHNQILDMYEDRAAKVPRAGKCLIMAGPSGAGKSTFLKRYASNTEDKTIPVEERLDVVLGPDGKTPTNYVVINPDDFKDYLPVDAKRYPGLNSKNEVAGIVHEESSYLAKRAVRMLMSQGINVILDITLADADKALDQYVAPYKNTYQYECTLVDGDMKMALSNAGNRYKQPDRKTGRRKWNGRFVPTRLVLGQAPTKPGFRSRNAEQFAQFIVTAPVATARIYDPYSKRVRLVHADERHLATLSAMLRVGRDTMTHQTTDITRHIQAFRDGTETREALVRYLTVQVQYVVPEHPYEPGTDERYHWVEGGTPYVPGSFDEVTLAVDTGLLSRDVYQEVLEAFERRSGVSV